MNPFVDIYHDKSKTVLQQIMADRPDLPPFVVQHRAMTDDEIAHLSSAEFADMRNRMFPICSRAETWNSIAYFNRQPLVEKKAVLSPESFAAREMIRETLAKAASLWGLDDEEVEMLSKQVTLRVPKKAETDNIIEFHGTSVPVTDAISGKTVVAQFLECASDMPESERRSTATCVLKAASSVDTVVPEAQIRTLLQHAGAATCTREDALSVLDGVIPYIPHYAEAAKTTRNVRDCLRKMPEGSLMQPNDVNAMVDSLESISHRYDIRHAAVAEGLRRITTADIEAEMAEQADMVKLPGGIMARKSAIAENAMTLSDMMHNLYQVEAHRPEDIVTALGKLTPREILPLRNHIGA